MCQSGLTCFSNLCVDSGSNGDAGATASGGTTAGGGDDGGVGDDSNGGGGSAGDDSNGGGGSSGDDSNGGGGSAGDDSNGGSGGTAYPFQGPQDPSFENFTNTSADIWKVDWLGGVDYSAASLTGTGFLPSQGTHYMELPGYPFNYSTENEMRQDEVDFSHSTTMTFDYSVVGSTLTTSTGKVEMLFTSNGTVTLWSKTYTPSDPATTQQLNETVALPPLPDAGRLTIRISYSPADLSQRMVFDIDNIRVQ